MQNANVAPRICANCGTPAQAGEQFCGECGAPLAAPTTQNVYQTGGPIAPPPVQQTYTPPVAYSTTQTEVKRSGGNSMPLVIGGIVALLVIAGVVAFLLLGNKGNNTNPVGQATATPGGSVAVNTPSNNGGGGSSNLDNGELLKKAAGNMRAAQSYHIEAKGTSSGTALTMSGDLDIPGKKSQFTIVSQGVSVGAVIIDKDAYLSTDGGKTWTKTDQAETMVGSLGAFTGMWSSFNSADIDREKGQLKDGSPAVEQIDGVDCKHITTSGGLSSLGGGTSNVELWVTTADDPTVRQVRVVGTSSGGDDFTIKWSNINGDVNIQAPPTSN